jgi:ubiquinone/menaquinone biosynthesis C-methylase UbiE
VVDVHRFHEISEVNHSILNPLSLDQVLLIGDICQLHAGQRHLDLASGKGEMLCQYALRYGTTGIGVDIYDGCNATARARAVELGVDHAIEIVHDNASTYAADPQTFDVVSCIGATWIGGGLPGTLRLMKRPLRKDGWLLVGELFWIEAPPPEVERRLGYGDVVVDLAGVLQRTEDAGLDLVEMVLANHDTWDRYATSQWLNVSNWLAANPDDPEADDIRRTRDASRRQYLEIERQYVGWGVFIMRPR